MLNRTATIYPRVREDGGTWRELQLRDFFLDLFVGQGDPFDVQDFLGIPRSMNAGTQAHIALDAHAGQTDDGLVQNVLDRCHQHPTKQHHGARWDLSAYGIPNVVADERASFDGWFLRPGMFGF